MADPFIRDLLVRGSVWFSFLFYVLSLYGWLKRKPSTSTRRLWTAGCMVFAIHLALAFHLIHHWSHQEAWEATRLQGGFGDGIYLHYAVMIIWLADVVYWWFSPVRFACRQRWFTILIHAFLLFMWFNATVIFSKDRLWIVSSFVFAGLLMEALHQYPRSKSK